MSVKEFIDRVLGKKPNEETRATSTLIAQIQASMAILNEKASALNDNYIEEKNTIAQLFKDVETMVPAKEILGAKFEQDILGYITAVSSACDGVIAGKQGADIEGKLRTLKTAITQRLAMV